VSTGDGWTKADVLANNRIRFEVFRDHGVLPGATDTHTSEFFAGFVTEESDWGRSWGVHHYGLAGHQADKDDDDASVPDLRAATELPRFPSGELVATLLDGLEGGPPRALPINLPNTGQVADLPAAAMVECIGVASTDGVSARDVVSLPAWPGEHLRRVAASQELTVEAGLTGDPGLVLAAMLADPLTGRRPYEDVVAMTGELLGATAPWLPQFSRG
jgi:alpha-galactosidase/6-phospho-beta-glucosidase family protein